MVFDIAMNDLLEPRAPVALIICRSFGVYPSLQVRGLR
jgi:hypothetical protein